MTKKNSKASEEKDNKEEDIDPATVDNEDKDLEDDSDAEDKDEDLDVEDDEEEDDEENSDSEIDVDEEIEAEKKLGKPDPKKAHKRIKGKDVDVDEDDEEDEDEKPLSRREARELLASQNRETQEERAFDYARKICSSDKEAELVVMKWKNRSFPENLPLAAQINEAFAITHSKRLIAQRNEALRGLKNRDGIRNDPTNTYRDSKSSPSKSKPKMAPQDIAAIEASGLKWVPSNGRFEKKIRNGLIVKYPGKDIERVST